MFKGFEIYTKRDVLLIRNIYINFIFNVPGKQTINTYQVTLRPGGRAKKV